MASEPTTGAGVPSKDDLDSAIERLRVANEALSKAFIQQSLAWNDVSNKLRSLRERNPDLFTQDKET
jgi:hypothetical protein